ncbi:MAG TPA: hypothetical protein PKY77_15815 [Phycisphaerae bacterium]|nr:hypothetical protein [Phycisphaerae bacterium]HRY70723.1 hypothetical protein [Phycisphaerae bacterium]HSA28757.1 hypothetical protein [Phycisphaerae bacterium]
MSTFTRALPLLAAALLPTLVYGQASLPVVYVLDARSTWQQGCFPPCKCPLGPETPVKGTFKLVSEGFSDWYDRYAVTDVDWTVETAEGKVLHITGSGSYMVGGDFVLDQRLTLDLSTNGGASERFDSGMVIGGGLPRIDITVSINQLYCQDTVIHVIAAPQPPPPPVLYRLDPKSTWQQGCFPPCLCPTGPELSVHGTLTMRHMGFSNWYDHYAVNDVDWTVQTVDGKVVHLTGSGTYIVGGDFALTQRLTLDLSTDGGAAERFDSGTVLGSSLPRIDLTVSINDMYCYDTVIHVVAAPQAVPAVLYRLLPRSTYQEGCFGMCNCVLYPESRITGTFSLAPEDSNPLLQTYALTDVDWHSIAGTQPRHLTGKGLYKVGGEVALTQQLELDLAVNGGGPEHFDSGMVAGGAKFPLIDIQVTIGQLVCFDRPIHVMAAPVVDFNLDGSGDRADLKWFLRCVSGPEIGFASFGCAAADLDADGDVDQSDFGLLQRCWPEAGDLVDPACLE